MFAKRVKVEVSALQARELLGKNPSQLQKASVMLRNDAVLLSECDAYGRRKYFLSGSKEQIAQVFDFLEDPERIQKERDFTKATAVDRAANRKFLLVRAAKRHQFRQSI